MTSLFGNHALGAAVCAAALIGGAAGPAAAGGASGSVCVRDVQAERRAEIAIAAHATVEDQIRAAYRAFAAAQNARDAAAVRALFVDDADFLWVSDGQSFWGGDAVIERMSRFQRAEIWRVEPDLEAATVIQTGPETAILHMPLTLVIGAAESPNRLGFLVSIVFAKPSEGWKIAALLTTREKGR